MVYPNNANCLPTASLSNDNKYLHLLILFNLNSKLKLMPNAITILISNSMHCFPVEFIQYDEPFITLIYLNFKNVLNT